MEGLLWKYPGEFFEEHVTPFSRQQTCSSGGRMDLVYQDVEGAFLVVELKQDSAPRAAVGQLLEYRSEMLRLHPGCAVRLMLIAEAIAPNFRAGLESVSIECLEMPEARFRQVAIQKGEPIAEASTRPRAPTKPEAVRIGQQTVALAVPPPTPERQRRRNPFEAGSFYSKIFQIARDESVTVTQIRDVAIHEGAFDVEGRVQSTMTNLLKGVRRRGGQRDGHRWLIWDVAIDDVPLPLNGAPSAVASSTRITITNVRRLDGSPFDY